MKQENDNMQNDTRDLRLSVQQIEFLIDELERGIRPNEEMIDMLRDALENSDSETLNDFTA
jgi:hypothetical protein